MPSLTPHGEKLRSFRVSLGWSQLDLALRAGVSERTVRNAEKSRPLHHDFLGYLAKALGLPVTEITLPTAEFKTHAAGRATSRDSPKSSANSPPITMAPASST